uniref:Dihydrodipicolinate reductase N-terminal domain-containing protein n=2 Tax=Sphingobium baderi TaxID=1332080 RepID=A0A144J3H1_9SPHN|nr:hypothetical protein [Sphingobium baderi]
MHRIGQDMMPTEPRSAPRPPYRVAVWGPGKMGLAAIREILRLPETQLVAVLGYNRDNDGADISKLIGGAPTGVTVTTNMDRMIEAKPEVVIHTARDLGGSEADDEIIRLLESGINVISVHAYQYPRSRGQEFHQKFEDACKRGDTTFYSSGTNPGFLYERLAALATGVTNDIQYIKLQEFLRMENHAPESLVPVGFSTTLADMENNNIAAVFASRYISMALHFLADKLGMPIDRIEQKVTPIVTPKTITTPGGLTAKEGTVAYLVHSWTGYVGDKPFFVNELHWYLDDSVKPAAALHPYYYLVEIEGIPSVRVGLEVRAPYTDRQPAREGDRAPYRGPTHYLACVVNMALLRSPHRRPSERN